MIEHLRVDEEQLFLGEIQDELAWVHRPAVAAVPGPAALSTASPAALSIVARLGLWGGHFLGKGRSPAHLNMAISDRL